MKLYRYMSNEEYDSLMNGETMRHEADSPERFDFYYECMVNPEGYKPGQEPYIRAKDLPGIEQDGKPLLDVSGCDKLVEFDAPEFIKTQMEMVLDDDEFMPDDYEEAMRIGRWELRDYDAMTVTPLRAVDLPADGDYRAFAQDIPWNEIDTAAVEAKAAENRTVRLYRYMTNEEFDSLMNGESVQAGEASLGFYPEQIDNSPYKGQPDSPVAWQEDMTFSPEHLMAFEDGAGYLVDEKSVDRLVEFEMPASVADKFTPSVGPDDPRRERGAGRSLGERDAAELAQVEVQSYDASMILPTRAAETPKTGERLQFAFNIQWDKLDGQAARDKCQAKTLEAETPAVEQVKAGPSNTPGGRSVSGLGLSGESTPGLDASSITRGSSGSSGRSTDDIGLSSGPSGVENSGRSL